MLRPLLFTLALTSASALAAEPFFTKLEVFTHGQDGYVAYRVPGLAATNHGALLLFCDARKNSAADNGKMDLVMKRSSDGGKTWEPMRVLFTDPGEQTKIGNVSAVADRQTGAVHVVFCENLTRAFCLTTLDDGVTFQPPVEITETFTRFANHWEFFATGHAHGVQLASGRLAVPLFMSNVPRNGGGKLDAFYPGIVYSDDHGASWQAGGTVPDGVRMNENTIYETAEGGLAMNARTTSSSRKVARSADAGMTWSAPEAGSANLWGARCQASSLVTRDPAGKRVVLFTNPAGPDRKNITVRVSYDDGRTWPVAKLIEPHPAAYGDVAQLPDGTICLAYETGEKTPYSTLTVARFNLEWILSAPQAETRPPRETESEKPLAPAPGGKLSGITVDDDAAQLTGEWFKGKGATALSGPGYRHDGSADRGHKSARFVPDIPQAGRYEVRLLYPLTRVGSSKVKVTITSVDGDQTVTVNQKESALEHGVPRALGVFFFNEGRDQSVTVSNEGADGYVIIDGVQFVPAETAAAERAAAR